MGYYDVYGRKDGSRALVLAGDIAADSPEHALEQWVELYGDNYGKVIILPQTSRTMHRAFIHTASL